METIVMHEFQPLHVNVKSFNILRAITDTNFFSRVNLNPTSRIVLFSLANMYNPKKGFVYPKNSKLIKCTGASERALTLAVGELKKEGLIVISYDDFYRKIYFTQKLYELLEIVDKEKEDTAVEAEEKAISSPKNIAECVELSCKKGVVKNADGVVKNMGGVVKNAVPYIEQKKEQIKKQGGKDFLKFERESEVSEITKAFREGGYLTNRMQSEIILRGFHQFNVAKEQDYKVIFKIKKVWNFQEEDFGIFRFLREKAKSDMLFARKIENIEHEVEFLFAGFETEINALREGALSSAS